MSLVRTDCRFFNGFKPCSEHKLRGTTCDLNCQSFSPPDMRILIIKTGAAGDVIRTTPVLRKLRELHPAAEIIWLSKFPELVPTDGVDQKIFFDWENSLGLLHQKFDLLLSLDKSSPEAGIAAKIDAKIKKGFLLDQNGKIIPADQDAEFKWKTGFDDNLMKTNTQHFVEETFKICGYQFSGEKYWIDDCVAWKAPSATGAPVIGLNTGCGDRWTARLWPESHFENLAASLIKSGFGVILLGGQSEDQKNIRLAQRTGATYHGVKSLKDFSSVVSSCDVIVTSVTMTLHLAIAKAKRTILFNNIFPTNEFYLYGHGEILEPKLNCQACYKPQYDLHCPVSDCMSIITPQEAFAAVERQIKVLEKSPISISV